MLFIYFLNNIKILKKWCRWPKWASLWAGVISNTGGGEELLQNISKSSICMIIYNFGVCHHPSKFILWQSDRRFPCLFPCHWLCPPPVSTCPGIHLLSPVTCHLWPVICHLWPVTCHLWPVICHLLPVTCHLWPVICHLSPAQDPTSPQAAKGAACLPALPSHRWYLMFQNWWKKDLICFLWTR